MVEQELAKVAAETALLSANTFEVYATTYMAIGGFIGALFVALIALGVKVYELNQKLKGAGDE